MRKQLEVSNPLQLNKKTGRNRKRVWLLLVAVCLLIGCGKQPATNQPQEIEKPADTGFVVAGPESFDSADTAVLYEKNEEEQTITFYNTTVQKCYTLTYDGTTRYYDKYGQGASLAQMQVGEIVDVTFLKSKKHLTTMSLSQAAWTLDNIGEYEFDTIKGQIAVGSDLYKVSDLTCYYNADGMHLEKGDITAADVICIRGIDTTVYSISINKGHGYLRLLNDENFIGGWIEVGNIWIQKISPEMLLTITEGSYKVTVSQGGSSGVKDVVINRNMETVLDVGDIEVAKPLEGTVVFSLVPASAKLYVDGTLTDTSFPVTLSYGLHQLMAKADGYKTLTQYIRVGQESAGVEITLEEESEEDEKEDEKEADSTEETVTTGYKIHIDAPTGAEVYLDNSYKGIAPCAFDKEAGSHVITLRKEGYTTKSYTITVDEEKKDISYSFADLVVTDTLLPGLDAGTLLQQIFDDIEVSDGI